MTASDASLLLSRRDLDFLLYDWLEVEALCSRQRFAEHSHQTFDSVLDLCERIAADHFQPINRLLDTEEPAFERDTVRTPAALKCALEAFAGAGLLAAGQDAELGGMQLPCVVEKAGFAFFNAASVAAAAYPLLTIGNANLLRRFGTPGQIERYLRPMLRGRCFGTMCLSEPQAGSSLSDIRTRALPQPDGRFRLFGNKMWISGGDQDLSENIVHLVLAKVPAPDGSLIPGVKGISLFLVPKWLPRADGTPGERNDVVAAGLNHKMGYRGTTNCLMNFGEGRFTPEDAPGAIGELVGPLHGGLACMFHMMNEARIGVGLGAVMLGYAAYRHALYYARQRPQGRAVLNKDPSQPQIPIIGHPDVRRMLLAQKSYAEGGLALALYCARLIDDRDTHSDPVLRERSDDLLELLTPIAKSWPSQWCQEGNSLAIQVHGGYGYTRDFPVEQFYRDQRLNPIHEGTHGIQGIDLLGRKVRLNRGRALATLLATMREGLSDAVRLPGPWSSDARAIGEVGERIDALAHRLNRPENTERGLANASVFLEAFGHWVLAWIWLEQARVALRRLGSDTGESPEVLAFLKGKLQAARYFLECELPKVGPMLDRLERLEDTALAMRDEWF